MSRLPILWVAAFWKTPVYWHFCPRLSRYFLNQELKLSSVATWWCGQPHERDFVLQNQDSLVIKPINRSVGEHAVFGGVLGNKEKEYLRSQILTKPHLYIGQEQVSFSTLPAFIDHQIEPRNAVLRNFVVASGNDYIVMPGGLTRVARQKDDFIVSNQAGGISKDTWVLASEPDKPVSLWTQPKRNQLIDAVTEPLTSRAADNLFWVGRHLERTEAVTRLLRTVLLKLRETLEFKDPVDIECLKVLLQTLTQVTLTYPGFIKGDAQLLKKPEPELLSLAKDGQRKGSLTANIQAFFQAAFSIRDLWSQDTWRSVDNIHRRWQLRVINSDVNVEQLQNHLDDLITGIVAFTGLTSGSITREAAWLMLDSRHRLERALALIALLRSTLALRHEDALQNQVLEAVLASTDSVPFISAVTVPLSSYPWCWNYCYSINSSALSHLSIATVIKPYQCIAPGKRQKPPRTRGKSHLREEERLILKAYTDLRLSNVPELTQVNDSEGIYTGLEQILSNTTDLLWRISEVIAQTYFSHSQTSQLMIPNTPEDEL